VTTAEPIKPGDPAVPVNIDEVDVLALWRTEPITKIGRPVLGRLSGALIEYAREAYGARDIESLLLRAQARAIPAWLELADRLREPNWWQEVEDEAEGGQRRRNHLDIHGSCLLVAAYHGSRWAAAMLVLRLAQRGPEDDGYEARFAVLHALSRRYRLSAADPTMVTDRLGVRQSIEADLEVQLARRSPPPPPATKEAKPEPISDSTREADINEMCVLLESPDNTGDKDTKALVERYGVLRLPVPLCEMPDPDELAAALLAEFPWVPDVVDAIRAELHLVRRLSGHVFRLPPLLLLGDPGVGKSTFARRLCALANVWSATIFAGGSIDNRSLAGTARGWSSACPSFPLVVMRRFMTANPVILVEEIDKAGGSDRNGRLTDTLTTMLDPTLSGSWSDECLQVAADLSRVTWVVTANRLDLVPPPLRARCLILNFPRPRPQDFGVLLGGILRDIADEHAVERSLLPDLPPEAIDEMRRGFETGRLQARQLANLVRRLMSSQVMAEQSCLRH
jgi:ATP-dependent Lon protease